MKRVLLLLIVVSAYFCNIIAEDVIQVIPTTISAGLTDDDGICLELKMVNESFNVANLQFDLLLPSGVEYSYFEEGEAIPSTKKGKKIDYDFNIQTSVLSSGYTRFLFVPQNEMRTIENTGKILLYLYITTEESLQDGFYPIIMNNIRLDKSVTETVVIENASSFLMVGDSNPLATAAHVDLSGMTGYIPSFVVDQLNTDIASNTNLKSLNLSGTTFDNLGDDLVVPDNKDLLWYTSDKASLNREFTAGNWSTVCLPFTLETITVNTLLNNGCAVKEMKSYDPGQQEVTFDDVNTMSTGVPYLFKCSNLKTKPFENIDITNPEAISTGPRNVTYNNLTFKGTYELVEPSSIIGSRTIYGYKKNQFVKVESGQSGKVQPFRAYMELAGVAGTRGFISIDGLDDATGINEIVVPDAEKTTPIYDLQGRKVDGNYHSRGILIQNGKKIIKK